jgi:hypothetical protein
VNLTEYDFDWQRTYWYESSDYVPVSFDDMVKLTCTYDNSDANQPVVDGVKQEPSTVHWGDGSFDEMCLNYLSVAIKHSGSAEQGTCGGFRTCFDACEDDKASCLMTCMTASGESCLYCGADAYLDSSCLQDACPVEAIGIYGCAESCWDGDDWLGCLGVTCGAQSSAFVECAEETLAAGECVEDLAVCEGLAP